MSMFIVNRISNDYCAVISFQPSPPRSWVFLKNLLRISAQSGEPWLVALRLTLISLNSYVKTQRESTSVQLDGTPFLLPCTRSWSMAARSLQNALCRWASPMKKQARPTTRSCAALGNTIRGEHHGVRECKTFFIAWWTSVTPSFKKKSGVFLPTDQLGNSSHHKSLQFWRHQRLVGMTLKKMRRIEFSLLKPFLFDLFHNKKYPKFLMLIIFHKTVQSLSIPIKIYLKSLEFLSIRCRAVS